MWDKCPTIPEGRGGVKMSILQEYERIRKDIGEEKFARIEAFLAAHPDLLLSDVYYKEEVWNKFEEEDVQKRIESLGTLLSVKTKEGQLIWPIEFINEFTEEELKVCQKLIFKMPQQSKQGEENLSRSTIEDPAKGFRFEKSETLKEDIMKRLEEGIRPLFETERYKEYLKTAAKFHSYSFNNQLLIWLQCPEATRVAGFNKWKDLGRVVNKGERGLKIIACGEKKNKEKDDAGNEKEFIQRYFFPATVFDVSQTSGKDIILSPFDDHRLDGTFERFEQCRDALIQVAGCPVIFDAIPGGADGYWNRSTKEIHIKDSISQQATISTLVHEITHSRLHTDAKELKDRGAGRSTWEVEAESVSFIVCEQLGLDTSSESFGYIAGWSKDKDLPELKKSLELITKESQKLSGDILDVLEGKSIHQKKEDVLCQKR